MKANERTARARVAAASRHHPDDDKTKALARDFEAERLAAYIARVVESAPPLSAEQRDRLVLLLRGSQVGL
jgi:hypothetical protein